MTSALDVAIAREFQGFVHDPHGFVRFAFPWGKRETMLEREPGLEQWQANLLGHIGRQLERGVSPIRCAVRSGHGVGKSSALAMIRSWAMSTMSNCRGLITANTGQQLQTKTLPEFAKWNALAINSHWFEGTMSWRYMLEPELNATWRCDAVTWSAENPAAFAGLHNAGRRILLMFDEASEIPPIIWETAEGALTDQDTEIIWLAFGNPTQPTGRFADCFGAQRHLWYTTEVDARNVRRTNKRLIREWLEYYGEDSDFFKIRVRGMAPSVGTNQFIPAALVELAMTRPLPEATIHDPLVFGVDVARYGEDMSVIWRRRGYDSRSWPPLFYRELDTMQVAARVAQQAAEDKPDAIFVDIGSMGAGVVDRLRQLGVKCVGVDFGAKADRGSLFSAGAPQEGYYNKRAEMWGAARAWLKAGGALPDKPKEIRDDLTGVLYGERNELILLERKEDMKKRGLASPDFGDALALTFAYPVATSALAEEAKRLRSKVPDNPRERMLRRARR